MKQHNIDDCIDNRYQTEIIDGKPTKVVVSECDLCNNELKLNINNERDFENSPF